MFLRGRVVVPDLRPKNMLCFIVCYSAPHDSTHAAVVIRSTLAEEEKLVRSWFFTLETYAQNPATRSLVSCRVQSWFFTDYLSRSLDRIYISERVVWHMTCADKISDRTFGYTDSYVTRGTDEQMDKNQLLLPRPCTGKKNL